MHCLATNVAVWIRTLVRESLKEINGHYHHYEKNHGSQHHSAPAVAVVTTKSDAFLHQVAEALASVAGAATRVPCSISVYYVTIIHKIMHNMLIIQ